MDKAVSTELTTDGVKPEHLGNAAATINDLEKNGIGPSGVSQAALSEIDQETLAQPDTGSQIGDDSGVDYSATALNAGDDDNEADEEDFDE